mgnify:CR=1 FL=1
MHNNIHFIIGIWRSGTTLIREVLGMSKLVKIFPEHFVLLNQIDKAKDFEKIRWKMLADITNNPDFIHFAQPNIQQLEKDFAKARCFEEAILATYKSCLKENESASIFIDKNPIYSYYLPQLIELFPQAKFVWMLREPKDNGISRAKHHIQSFKNNSYLANWWNLTNEQIEKQATKYPDKFLLVPYDFMVQEPEPWIKKICHFLEVEFNPEMLAFEKKREERITDFILAAKARDGEISEDYASKKKAMWENLQKPINTSKTKQWEQVLNLKQIESVDKISSEYYQNLLEGNFGFKPSYSLGFKSLARLSLAKLKWDIQRKTLS